MATANDTGSAILRTERGLTIGGTRITLYDVMDYLLDGWPPKAIRDRLNLTDQQIEVAMDYIDAHRAEVEAEYRQVLDESEELRQYWEERNRERIIQIASRPPQPGQEALRAKLAEAKARYSQP
jgi:uncharacterized protein (DUF433 family)